MTVSELEKWVTEAKDVHITYEVSNALSFHDNDTSWLKDLIADWRLMRRYVEGWQGLQERAENVLAELKLKP